MPLVKHYRVTSGEDDGDKPLKLPVNSVTDL